MRYSGLIILLLIGCKAAPPATSFPTYEEDLSGLRPTAMQESESDTTSLSEEFVPLKGHIKAELDSIVRVSVANNKVEKIVDGFVIQVYTGNSRSTANRVWAQLDQDFPQLDPTITYHQPNFRVNAGKFTDRLEAHRVFRDVKKIFPRSLLVPERFKISYD